MTTENKTTQTTKSAIAVEPVSYAVPIRIQRSRQHKQVSPNILPIVYVGRPNRFGNKFKIGEWSVYLGKICENIDDVIESYKKQLKASGARQRLAKHYLSGKNLSCWCKLDCKCHADVLLKFVAGHGI